MKYATTVAAVTIALMVLASPPLSTLGLSPFGQGGRPTLAMRQALELAVMALQVGGVVALAWLKVAPGSTIAGWSLMGAQVGLGVCGALCAGFDSGFALFAGATLVVLLLGAIHDEGFPPVQAPRGRQRPAMANV